ncbi:hypothetical protein L204_100381 [Cryptococcus depauperatus]|nr:hypothetical protein L204_02136 [Cryptococcus depauperatus CBS 7855]
MSQIKFILAPDIRAQTSQPTQPLPTAPTLSLLPFSLGSQQSPFSSKNAPISAYFCPHSICQNGRTNLVASFRGRQMVGQSVAVPPDYRGLLLSATLQPGMDAIEMRGAIVEPSDSTCENVKGESAAESIPKRGVLAKIKGAGQVALAKPRTRRAAAVKKRVRLDSDDEEDGGENQEEQPAIETPVKKSKINIHTPASGSSLQLGMPEIRVQEATPLKQPVCESFTHEQHLHVQDSRDRHDSPPCGQIMETEGAVVDLDSLEEQQDAKNQLGQVVEHKCDDAQQIDQKTLVKVGGKADQPCPILKIEPPQFNIPPAPFHSPAEEDHLTQDVKLDPQTFHIETEQANRKRYDDPIRLLTPIATFEAITLWTGDVPLVGKDSEEEKNDIPDIVMEEKTAMTKVQNDKHQNKLVDKSTGLPTPMLTPTSCTKETRDIQVRPSWWPLGGSGEGGDEFVRGMGEFLGLIDVLNKPVYLDGLEDWEDDD